MRTTCARSATPKSGGSTPRSSWACWSTGPVLLYRSAAGRATGPRPPRSSPSRRHSKPPTAPPSPWWSPGAGMLSAANLTALDDARLRFIVGARTTRAPGALEAHFHWHGDAPADGQVIDTITPKRGSNTERDKNRKAEPVWDPHTHPGSWRAMWACSKKRAAQGQPDPDPQANRARVIRRRREASQGHAFRHHPSRRSGPFNQP